MRRVIIGDIVDVAIDFGEEPIAGDEYVVYVEIRSPYGKVRKEELRYKFYKKISDIKLTGSRNVT